MKRQLHSQQPTGPRQQSQSQSQSQSPKQSPSPPSSLLLRVLVPAAPPIQVEEIAAREYGNPLIARGTFGEVFIGIQLPPSSSTSSTSTSPSQDNTGTRSSILHPPKARYVAIKTIRNAVSYNNDKSSHEFTPAVFTELASLRALSPHVNIVPLLHTIYDTGGSSGGGGGGGRSSNLLSSNSISFVFPYCPCDLQEIINHYRHSRSGYNNSSIDHSSSSSSQNRNILTKQIIKHILKDICNGLNHCHSNGIIHCDIKPGNILLSSNGTFQLADFGIAKTYIPKHYHSKNQKNSHEQNTAAGGGLCTLYYRPPELLYGSTTHYQPSIDMWSLGCVIVELQTLKPLFPGWGVMDQLSKIMTVCGTPTIHSWPTIHTLPDYHKVKFTERDGVGLKRFVCVQEDDGSLLDLVEGLVVMDPEKRLSVSECLVHPWLVPPLSLSSKSTSDSDIDIDIFGLGSRNEITASYILQNMIIHKDLLGDDGFQYGSSMSKVTDNINGVTELNVTVGDEDYVELLDQMKLQGVAMAEMRRNWNSFRELDLEIKMMEEKKEKIGNTSNNNNHSNHSNHNDGIEKIQESSHPTYPSTKGEGRVGLGRMLAAKMKSNTLKD